MPSRNTLQLHLIIDQTREYIAGIRVTDQMRADGILLTESAAAWWVANRIIVRAVQGDIPQTPNRPVEAVALDEILVPLLEPDDAGKFFILRNTNAGLRLSEFDPLDDGDGTGIGDIGDMAALFLQTIR